MENEQVTITLTVAQWQALLNALGHAPWIIVDPVNPIVAFLQQQANPQIAEYQRMANEAAATEENSDQTQG